MRRGDVDAGDLGREDDLAQRRPAVGEDVGHRSLDGVEVDPEARGQVRLRIHVDAQDAIPLFRECAGEVDRRRRLADAALLIGDRDHVGHRGITSNRSARRDGRRGGESRPCYSSGRCRGHPVIHTDRELFTISVDNWDRMMATVLAQRQPDSCGGRGPLSTNEERLARLDAMRAAGAARRRTGAHRPAARARKADGARATGAAARRRVVRRDSTRSSRIGTPTSRRRTSATAS